MKLGTVYKTRDGRDAVLIGRRVQCKLYALIWAEGRSVERVTGRVWGTDEQGFVGRYQHKDDVMVPA